MSFYKKIVEMVLKPGELAILRNKAAYDEDLNEYKIPPFKLKENQMSLP